MISSDVRTAMPRRPPSTSSRERGGRSRSGTQAVFTAVLVLLLSTGWVANHFVALMPLIGDRQHLSVARLDAIFGIYALGLLPGLLLGGRVSDALGRQSVALAGATAPPIINIVRSAKESFM